MLEGVLLNLSTKRFLSTWQYILIATSIVIFIINTAIIASTIKVKSNTIYSNNNKGTRKAGLIHSPKY